MRFPRLPRTVWMLGLVSLFMDMSSEFIHAVLPVYLTTTLGLSVLAVGIVEGIAEATASIMKVFSGVISDRFRKRKALVLTGYGLAALTKPVFPLANTALEVVTARFVDRIGKGIRGAPRDALMADVTPPALLNTAYGIRQSLDTVGAFAGPLLAMLMLYWYSHDLRLVMWVAVIPALACVGLILWGVREPDGIGEGNSKPRLHWRDARKLPFTYWLLLVLTGVVTLARMTDALLVLRAQENGLQLVWIPLVLVVYSAVYAVSVWPVGVLAERIGQRGLLLVGMACLAISQWSLAEAATTGALFWLGISLWGLHMGLTQGLLAARVAQLAPGELRGTSFGLFHLTIGVMQLLAGVGFGWLWVAFSAGTAFQVAAVVSLASLPLLWMAWSPQEVKPAA
ncbi:MFS transporter [Thiothrix nivea]|uniref:Major facilitator superfamily MFS_1 n=1 Tax=Thiothrix nivea (strain ATCC 35100 / DSM 5205 / JP2) TaxID=870187 RepID=A0A656HD18_THINJ|nr:MFS transporter [Thiothrix nivea]EIJ32925.1 major facilitator superfamily MFS_1 [Thiothrix nivea DSM 5205]